MTFDNKFSGGKGGEGSLSSDCNGAYAKKEKLDSELYIEMLHDHVADLNKKLHPSVKFQVKTDDKAENVFAYLYIPPNSVPWLTIAKEGTFTINGRVTSYKSNDTATHPIDHVLSGISNVCISKGWLPKPVTDKPFPPND